MCRSDGFTLRAEEDEMPDFKHHVEEPERMTANAVLDGVKRMLERMSVHEAPSDPKEARGHKLALASAVNALCRGEWQR